MVSTRGQIDAPLVDIANVRQEYWQRKEVRLPSIAKFMPKKKAWFGLREIEQEPKIILRRLTEEEWRSINERFWKVRDNLAKKLPVLRKLYDKASKGQKLKATEQKVLNHSQTESMPIYIAMLELMIEEPDMSYDEVRVLVDAVDEYDRQTLLSYVNSLTSEKAIVAHRINEERMDELNKMERQVAAGI